MKKITEQLWGHGVLLVSAFAMLAAVTVAWFIQSHTVNVTPMSFAAQNSGGATLYKTLEENGVTDRTAAKDAGGVLSITNTAHWKQTPETPEQADVTVENLLPGQCEYYFILANGPTDVKLTNITLERGDGETADLADCLALYLIPVTNITDKPPVESRVAVTLTRQASSPGDQTVPPLEAAYFLGTPTDPITLPPTPTGAEASNAYILVLACDPLYGQDRVTNTLGGKVSFSLQFDAATVS